MSDHAEVQAWLERFVAGNGGVAGSVHARQGDDLALCAALNLPPPVVQAVTSVPRGKGMAGLALERNAPVQTCNLKEDRSGDVRPGARAVDASAAVAIPVHRPDGQVRGVVGIAFRGEREISADELARLAEQAEGAPI